MAATPLRYQRTYKPGGYKTKSPEYTGVSFFQHFLRQMLRLYGIAYEFSTAVEAFTYLKPFTCEWLKCPEFAMSEMADSISRNLDVLAESDCRVLRNGKVIRLLKNNKDFPTSLVRLNCTNNFTQTEQDIYNVMHFLQDDSSFTEFPQKSCCLGQAMYLIRIHYFIAELIVTNPTEYAAILQSTAPAAKSLKQNLTLDSLANYFLSEITKAKMQRQTHHPTRYLAKLIKDLKNNEQQIQQENEQMPSAQRVPPSQDTELPTEEDLFSDNANMETSRHLRLTSLS